MYCAVKILSRAFHPSRLYQTEVLCVVSRLCDDRKQRTVTYLSIFRPSVGRQRLRRFSVNMWGKVVDDKDAKVICILV